MVDHITTHQAEEDARNESILIWVNGALKPKAEALVSVYDSGFMLGDGRVGNGDGDVGRRC